MPGTFMSTEKFRRFPPLGRLGAGRPLLDMLDPTERLTPALLPMDLLVSSDMLWVLT